MKKVIYFAVLVVVLLSACSSESDARIEVPVTQQETITFLCNGFTQRTENMAKKVVTRASETTSFDSRWYRYDRPVVVRLCRRRTETNDTSGCY